jgi:hypothetical protein
MGIPKEIAPNRVTSGEMAPAALKRLFRLCSDAPPPEALTWSDDQQKRIRRRRWRQATMQFLGPRARLLRVAWILYDLSGQKGYAYAGNTTLAVAADMPIKKLEAALTQLERGGVIVRAHFAKGESTDRRIYLPTGVLKCRADTPQNGRDACPPKTGVKNTPHPGGTEIKERRSLVRQHRAPSTVGLAQRDAERRAARARGERPPGIFDDD